MSGHDVGVGVHTLHYVVGGVASESLSLCHGHFVSVFVSIFLSEFVSVFVSSFSVQ